VICTEPFRQTVEAICQTRGVAGFPFVIIDHPIGSLSEEELQGRAEIAAKQVIAILTANQPRSGDSI